MRAWNLSLLILPLVVTAWAAGCSDDNAVADGGADAGGDHTTPLPDGSEGAEAATTGNDGGEALPPGCENDLDIDGLVKHLRCTGLYSAFETKTLANGVLPYKPAIEFWSDGAEKSRWLRIPAGTKINISDFDEWVFPNRTKAFKEFKLGGKRIETRVFAKQDDGTWLHASYRWNDDETDAVRKDGGESIPGLGPDGGIYEIPSSGQCTTCHAGRIDSLLGVEAVNLGLPGASGQTLAKLASDGFLSAAPPSTTLALPANSAGTTPDTAAPGIGWLHANCGACHNPNKDSASGYTGLHMLVHATQLAPTDGGVAAKVEDLDVYKTGYCKIANRPDAEDPTVKYRIAGADPSHSETSLLSGRRNPPGKPASTAQMPPIVTHAVDVNGHALFDAWIASLPACP